MHLLRTTLGCLIAGSALFYAVEAAAPCERATSLPRKEVNTLSTGEWNAYVGAIKALKAEMRSTASFGSVSTYDLLVKIHLDNAPWVHGYATFFSWHRRYLREVERHLQRVTGNTQIMIPYWDWTRDSQAPEASPIYSSRYFGGNGGSGGCVRSGSFSGWTGRFPSSHCLQRQFDSGSRISAWDSEELIASIIVSSTTYDDIRQQIEGGGHALVHVGTGGDMSVMQSPNDPIFWSHHGFIDKIWNDWQKQNGWSNYWSYNGPNVNGGQVQLTDVMTPWSQTVRQILWTENLGYCYAERSGSAPVWLSRRADDNSVPSFIKLTSDDDSTLSPATDDEANNLPNLASGHGAARIRLGAATDTNTQTTAVDSLDRTNLFKLRYPGQVPEDYLRRNNLDVDTVRSYEAKKRDLCDSLNKQDDYISPCALANHPYLLEKVSTYSDVKTMYGKAGGQKIEIDMTKARSSRTTGFNFAQQVSRTVQSRFGKYMKNTRSRYMQVIQSRW